MQNSPTYFHLISFIPKTILDTFPISCAIVKTGTATFEPKHIVTTGSSSNAPPNPATPDKTDARKLTKTNTAYVIALSPKVCINIAKQLYIRTAKDSIYR
jgi:hypothetical protein